MGNGCLRFLASRPGSTLTHLAPALEAAFKAGGVQLVVVPVDYSKNIRVLVEELERDVG